MVGSEAIRMKKIVALCIVAIVFAPTLFGQLRDSNGAGIAAAFVGFSHTTAGSDQFNSFWIALGGVEKRLGPKKVFSFPGIFIQGDDRQLSNPSASTGGQLGPLTSKSPRPAPVPGSIKGGSEGSRIDYIGFKVRDLTTVVRSLERAGFPPTAKPTGGTLFLLSPNGAKVQLKEEKTLTAAIEADEVLIRVPDIDEAGQWYQKWLGATVARDGNSRIAQVPGLKMRFVESKEALAPTNGRAIDRLGFEVMDLRTFSERIVPSQITVRGRYFTVDPTFAPLKAASLVVDPWGVTIEFDQGFRDIR